MYAHILRDFSYFVLQHYETVASPSVINKLRKELDNRQNNAGHWKAKESLIEVGKLKYE